MQVNRCIPCSDGTYSFQAINPYGCLPCPDDQGAICKQGHLLPTPGYFQRNPLLPQLVACPLTKACKPLYDPEAVRKQLEGLKALQREYPQQPLAGEGDRQQAQGRRLTMSGSIGAAAAASARTWSRGLLQAGAEESAAEGALDRLILEGAIASCRCSPQNTSSEDSKAAGDKCTGLSDGLANRTCVLREMQRSLADAFTGDEESKVAGSYPALLRGWQQMQCELGYTGDLCGTCMPGLTPEAAAMVANTSDAEMLGFGRYAFRCLQCKSVGIEVLVLIAVFLAQAVYIAVGVMLQVRAPHKVLLGRGPTRVERIRLGFNDEHIALEGANAKGQLAPGKLPAQEGGQHEGEGRGLQQIAVDVSDMQQLERDVPRGTAAPQGGDGTGSRYELFSAESLRGRGNEGSFWSQFIRSGSFRPIGTGSLRKRNSSTTTAERHASAPPTHVYGAPEVAATDPSATRSHTDLQVSQQDRRIPAVQPSYDGYSRLPLADQIGMSSTSCLPCNDSEGSAFPRVDGGTTAGVSAGWAIEPALISSYAGSTSEQRQGKTLPRSDTFETARRTSFLRPDSSSSSNPPTKPNPGPALPASAAAPAGLLAPMGGGDDVVGTHGISGRKDQLDGVPHTRGFDQFGDLTLIDAGGKGGEGGERSEQPAGASKEAQHGELQGHDEADFRGKGGGEGSSMGKNGFAEQQVAAGGSETCQKQLPAATLLAIWKVLTNYIQVSHPSLLCL